MSEIRVGVLGVGHIGAVHAQSAMAMAGVSLVGIADVSSSNRALARKLGVPSVYAEYAELLEAEAIDVAVVALPPFLHEDATTSAVAAGCDVFVEKPFARTSEEADRMIEAADEADVRLGVDHTLRYQPEMRELKAAYDSGRLGAVPLCHLARINDGPFEQPPPTSPVPDWPLDAEATGGGAVMDLGVHLFDFLEWIFGDMSVSYADLGRQLDLEYEDTALVVLRSRETGTLASAHCGFYQWEEPPTVNMHVRLDGVSESISSAEYVPDFYRHAGRSAIENVARRLVGKEPEYFQPTYYYRAHFEALQAFVDAIRDGREPPVSGRDGKRAIELIEETYAAAEENEREHERSSVRARGGPQ